MKNLEKIFESEKTANENPNPQSVSTGIWPDSSYRVITKPRGKSKSYKDYFGKAVSGFERTLRSPEAKNRETVPSTLAEQIAYSNKSQLEDTERAAKAKAERKRIAEEPRFASWIGNTDVCFKNGRGPVCK